MSKNTQRPPAMPGLPHMLLLSASLHWAVLVWIEPVRVGAAAVTPPLAARLIQPHVPAAIDTSAELPPTQFATEPRSVDPVAASAPPTLAPAPVESLVSEKDEVVTTHREMTALPSREALASPPALLSVPALFDPTWYEARQLDVRPRAVQTIQPDYPARARREGIEGNVRLMLKVDENGEVREVKVMEAEPAGVFDTAALAAFGSARFVPAQRNGLPVRALIYIRVSFRLD